ncbi:MAG TPA: Rieske 2Fe-2S domain-containing protein [Mycobacteriales bacterium]|nr:Rieske 2Fe-2S domain-containing protein [Mycobacteriales bacterium]
MSEQWIPVARSADVTTVPRPVQVAGRPYVAVRPAPDAPAVVVAALCPHRLVPLTAATVDGGRLRCAYHGWEFDSAGACVVLPSLGEQAHIPPRAHLAAAPESREADGQVWARLDDLPPDAPAPTFLRNTDPALRAAWHPVALSAEVGPEPYEAMVVGQPYTLRRADGLTAAPEPAGLVERWGMVWLAPDPPRHQLFVDPDAEDADFVGAWLPPARTTVNAGFVADNFLDVAHFPFVHTGTFGADADRVVEPAEVQLEPGGFRSVQEQWFDNPEDPGVASGERPLRQRRRATYVYRAPFQLLLRLEELDAGSVKTILFLMLPETDTSTRIYTKMLLHNIGGELRPGPETVAREVAFEEAVLAEDLRLQAVVTVPGLPLDMRTELHVRADRLGVALRRELVRFLDR